MRTNSRDRNGLPARSTQPRENRCAEVLSCMVTNNKTANVTSDELLQSTNGNGTFTMGTRLTATFMPISMRNNRTVVM